MDNKEKNKGTWFLEQLNLYQSANSDSDSVKRNFIIRVNEFETIINSLKNKGNNDPLQHELILGRRGSGKSTLLKRIQIEIDEKSQFSTKYIAVNLAEEQAGIYRLFDLWEQVIEELICKLNLELKLKDFKEFKLEQEFTRYLYQVIHEICSNENKKIVLLLDNFDRIVENFTDDGNLLRETLINYNDIQIIAGSTRMDEHFWQYDKPFYEFFRRHRLEALSSEEINTLINHWSLSLEIPELKDYVEHNRGKIENIRILTDGLPRTLQFFIQILLQNSQLYGYEYLRKVMDNTTPLYQERLNYLTPQLRKIISEMAFIWEACTTKQLVEKCRMESKLISANLKTLIDKGIVEKIETSKRNHLYRISERFFNMWLIITQGNPEQKRKAKWLSIFLENWYDVNDFKKLADEHIHNLKVNKLGYNQALVVSKALSQCKYISIFERDTIIELTENLNDEHNYDNLLELPKKYSIIRKEVGKLIKEKKNQEAIKLILEIENEEDGIKFSLLGDLYFHSNDKKNSEKYLLLAIEKGKLNKTYNLAVLFHQQKKYSEAKKYYLLSIENNNNPDSNFNLGLLFHEQGKVKDAEKYYLEAIRSGNDDALYNLALLYDENENYELSEKYYLLAIEKNDDHAMNNLAIQYYFNNYNKEKSLELIEKYNKINFESKAVQPQIIIEVWNGIFDNLEGRLINDFQENHFENLDLIICQLLIHQQKRLILKLFNNEEFGEELQGRYAILYYVTLILNNLSKENLELKIPPEISVTVNDVISEISERQKKYEYL
ncbi:tetratricopeptide repeat protein [Flavobacterium gyeonganense]|uniref:Tetratricopeptide repeat protein n=1 Tax=Flavobacterium gyeonganense TaxID=1310418 RepID=A0ABV5HH24_9FLAO|nr:tetratricopeptide repeat protein [Flavobacterium gyeonganense]